jgi:hypothetical protein
VPTLVAELGEAMLDAPAIGTVALMLEALAQLVLLVLEPFTALIETAFLAPLLEPLLRHGAEGWYGKSRRENAEKSAPMHRSPP